MEDNKRTFLELLELSCNNDDFINMKISKPSDKDLHYKKIFIRKIVLKDQVVFNCVYNNKTQDITKNYNLQEYLHTCNEFIWNDFKNAVLFTKENDITLSYNKKWIPKIFSTKSSKKDSTNNVNNHNNTKQRLINTDNNIYLQKLWVINSNNVTVNSKVGKLRQIHKFIETLSSSIKQSSLENKINIKVTDMWSGKWYLTFAVYDYIKNILDKNVVVNWIEFRKDLVEICNDIALDCCFDDLNFIQWTIEDTQVKDNNILIALHACDTATDDAIHKWITSNSELIVLSPCCHKQIRKEVWKGTPLDSLLAHGIFKERQSEMVTDTLRWLIMELHGYKTKIFEYIADEHTHKNTMIVWIKHTNLIKTEEITKKIQDFKKMFWIDNVYLEKLLK